MGFLKSLGKAILAKAIMSQNPLYEIVVKHVDKEIHNSPHELIQSPRFPVIPSQSGYKQDCPMAQRYQLQSAPSGVCIFTQEIFGKAFLG